MPIIMADKKGGGTDYFQYARRLDNFFYIPYNVSYLFPFETIEINAPLVESILGFYSTGAFSNASQANRGVKKIKLTIKLLNATGSGWFDGAKDLEEVEIHGIENSVVSGINGSLFFYLPALKRITGIVFDGASANWTYATKNNPIYLPSSALEEIRFVPNSMTYNGTYRFGQHGSLSSDSLVSIANAMDETNQTKQIELHATASAKLSAILGTVADGAFSLNASGNVTLLDFITNTKGWTIV